MLNRIRRWWHSREPSAPLMRDWTKEWDEKYTQVMEESRKKLWPEQTMEPNRFTPEGFVKPVTAQDEIASLKASLVRAYDLAYKYWNEEAGHDFNGDEAKELRRDIWDQCLAPHGLPHPKGWAT